MDIRELLKQFVEKKNEKERKIAELEEQKKIDSQNKLGANYSKLQKKLEELRGVTVEKYHGEIDISFLNNHFIEIFIKPAFPVSRNNCSFPSTHTMCQIWAKEDGYNFEHQIYEERELDLLIDDVLKRIATYM